jgi:hypothetical protein
MGKIIIFGSFNFNYSSKKKTMGHINDNNPAPTDADALFR